MGIKALGARIAVDAIQFIYKDLSLCPALRGHSTC